MNPDTFFLIRRFSSEDVVKNPISAETMDMDLAAVHAAAVRPLLPIADPFNIIECAPAPLWRLAARSLHVLLAQFSHHVTHSRARSGRCTRCGS